MLKFFSKTWFILQGSRRNLPWLLLTFICSSVLEALGIGLIGPFLNLASNPQIVHDNQVLNRFYIQLSLQSSNQLIPILGLIIAALFCIKSLLYFFSRYYILKYSFHIQGQITYRLLKTYLSVPYTFYLRKNTANIIKNMTYEVMRINHFSLQPLLTAIANITVISILLFLLAATNLTFLILVLGIMLPTFIIFYKLRNKFIRWGKESCDANQEIIRIINHSLGGFKETKLIGCEQFFQNQMEEQIQKFASSSTKFNSYNSIPRIAIETCLIVFVLLFISISQLLWQQDIEETTSIMAVFAVASIRLIPAASQTMQAIGQIQHNTYSVDSIYLELKEIDNQHISLLPTYTNLSSIQNTSLKRKDLDFKNEIQIKNLSYYYPNTYEPALQDISLAIKKGQSVAFIGKSGAGKTTLVDVILGLLTPEVGNIYIDNNYSIYNDIRSWQNLIGYIPQSIFLIDDTIEKNIAFGVPAQEIDQKKLEESIKAAQLEEVISDLPNGIKTFVGERGIRLSGGQRQRIGIARALYHEREILVLDEATSALDNETERLVSEAIRSLAGRKTLIIIAHRLSTIKYCDQVFLMKNGSVIESGSFEEIVLKENIHN